MVSVLLHFFSVVVVFDVPVVGARFLNIEIRSVGWVCFRCMLCLVCGCVLAVLCTPPPFLMGLVVRSLRQGEILPYVCSVGPIPTVC